MDMGIVPLPQFMIRENHQKKTTKNLFNRRRSVDRWSFLRGEIIITLIESLIVNHIFCFFYGGQCC